MVLTVSFILWGRKGGREGGRGGAQTAAWREGEMVREVKRGSYSQAEGKRSGGGGRRQREVGREGVMAWGWGEREERERGERRG